jgi:hypothetical protein
MFPEKHDPFKYRGDGFELFAEALIKLSPVNNEIGVFDYRPVVSGDTGVDGYGIGSNGTPATVQVKFRANTETVLTANEDHLTNFLATSQNKYGVLLEDRSNMLVITNAKELHYFTEAEMLHGKVRCLGNERLRLLVDNNNAFWHHFRLLCQPWYNKK